MWEDTHRHRARGTIIIIIITQRHTHLRPVMIFNIYTRDKTIIFKWAHTHTHKASVHIPSYTPLQRTILIQALGNMYIVDCRHRKCSRTIKAIIIIIVLGGYHAHVKCWQSHQNLTNNYNTLQEVHVYYHVGL